MNTKRLIPNLPNPRWYCWLQMKSLLVFPENIFEGKLLKIKFTKRRDVFVPRTWSGCYDQISEFFYCESLVFLFWSAMGCNLAAHSFIHASFIQRRGLTRFQLPKGFLGLRIVECRNSSDKLEWGPGALESGNITSHCSQSFISPDWIPTGTYS